jgi:hypothetical protein
MSHQAKFIHIICTDPRIQKIYHDYLIANNLFGRFDTIEYENPMLDFLKPEKLEEIIKRIKLYVKLHGADTIVLFDHFDCGAYKEHGYNFSNEQDEYQAHLENNSQILSVLEERLPEMKAEIKYIQINHDGQCSWWQPNA